MVEVIITEGKELKEYKYHCNCCMCPIEQWKPLETYNSDRSCEIYSDFFNVIWDLEEKNNTYSFKDILERCATFKAEYSDIEDFEATIKECVDIGVDTGIMTELYLSGM